MDSANPAPKTNLRKHALASTKTRLAINSTHPGIDPVYRIGQTVSKRQLRAGIVCA